MVKVSVVVPVYKAEDYIERCARSLFEQTLPDIEYIFVNDCTPDRSMQILSDVLSEYKHRIPYVKIVNHKYNTGQSEARRDGMLLATGDFIIHCDSDDYIDQDLYERMYNAALENNADAVCCDIIIESADECHIKACNENIDDHKLMYDCLAPISVEYCSLANRMFSRSIIESNNILPFNGVNMWDDVGVSIRCRYYSRKTVTIHGGGYHYVVNMSSTTKRRDMGKFEEMVKCVKGLEDFFYNQGVYELYKHFIAYLKCEAKECLTSDQAELWLNTFPEVKSEIWHLTSVYPLRTLIKLLCLSYLRHFGAIIWKWIKA